MGRQAERREQARRKLLNAACEVFSERGYSESSLDEVAQRAGVSRGLIYHHFGSKDGLLLALHEELDEALISRVRGAAGQGGLPLDNLVRGARAFIEAVADLPVARITLLDTPGAPGLRAHAEEGQREWARLMETELARGIQQGSIRSVDPAMTARVLLGALQEAALAVLSESDPPAAARRAQDSVERLIEGLRS